MPARLSIATVILRDPTARNPGLGRTRASQHSRSRVKHEPPFGAGPPLRRSDNRCVQIRLIGRERTCLEWAAVRFPRWPGHRRRV